MPNETFSFDGLRAGDFPIITDTEIILSGEDVLETVRGAILGKVTANGKLRVIAANGDGSQNIYAILLQDIDASGGDIPDVAIALTGEFDESKLSVGDSTVDARKDAARALGIFFKNVFAK